MGVPPANPAGRAAAHGSLGEKDEQGSKRSFRRRRKRSRADFARTRGEGKGCRPVSLRKIKESPYHLPTLHSSLTVCPFGDKYAPAIDRRGFWCYTPSVKKGHDGEPGRKRQQRGARCAESALGRTGRRTAPEPPAERGAMRFPVDRAASARYRGNEATNKGGTAYFYAPENFLGGVLCSSPAIRRTFP